MKAGGGGCVEEEAKAHDRKLGFSLALCPGHQVIPQTLYDKHHQGGHSDSTEHLLRCQPPPWTSTHFNVVK